MEFGATNLYILILFDITTFQTKHTSLCIKINAFHTDGESGSDATAARRSGRRFILHFTNCCRSNIIVFANQIVCMPHIFWFFGHKSHRADVTNRNWNVERKFGVESSIIYTNVTTYPCIPLSTIFEISFILMCDFLFQYYCIEFIVTYFSLFYKISFDPDQITLHAQIVCLFVSVLFYTQHFTCIDNSNRLFFLLFLLWRESHVTKKEKRNIYCWNRCDKLTDNYFT